MHFLVLLKKGAFSIVECAYEEIFKVANARDAGICGVFLTRVKAEEFISRAHIPATHSTHFTHSSTCPSFP